MCLYSFIQIFIEPLLGQGALQVLGYGDEQNSPSAHGVSSSELLDVIVKITISLLF